MNENKFPPVFNSEELVQNELRKKELIELVGSKQALLVVGAGSSALIGYSTWPKLLKKLEELACECARDFNVDEIKRENDPLGYADDIKNHIKKNTKGLDKYHKLLQKEFCPRNPGCKDFHKTLVRLPFKGILTTNYDKVLEAALGEINPEFSYDNSLIIKKNTEGRISEFFLSLDFKEYPRRIAHLHGRFDEPDSIILSSEDYSNFYGFAMSAVEGKLKDDIPKWSLHRKFLWSVLATRRIVFIGFSMNDLYLNTMLDFVCRDLWRWNESIHFAVMSISQIKADETKEKAKKLKRDFGIEVVFYEDIDDSHRGLEQIIAEVDKNYHGQHTSEWLEIANRLMEEKFKTDEN